MVEAFHYNFSEFLSLLSPSPNLSPADLIYTVNASSELYPLLKTFLKMGYQFFIKTHPVSAPKSSQKTESQAPIGCKNAP